MSRVPFAPLRMTLLAIVAIAPLLPVMTAVGLGRGTMPPMRLSRDRCRLEPLYRLGGSREVGRQRRDRDPLARRALDIAQIAALVRSAESDCDSGCAGAGRAADAVDIL